jgi:Ca2+-binding RTX toxin-like protein
VDLLLTGVFADQHGNIDVGAGDDVVLGGDSGDKIRGQDGADVILGYGGSDIITPGPGADRVYGGDGDDTVYYTSSPVGVVADLDGEVGDDGAPGEGDTLGSNVENLQGSQYNDVLTGNSGDNDLTGCGGSDQLYGLDGNDVLQGDFPGCGPIGADVMVGGPGVDAVWYQGRTAQLIVDLGGTTANDGEAGEHDMVGADVENLTGSDGNDKLIGSSGPNTIQGGSGNDVIYGVDGDDILYGWDGNDYLDGGNGADQLNGQAGTDTCVVGPGGLSTTGCE